MRTLAEARCRAKGHLLARLYVADDARTFCEFLRNAVLEEHNGRLRHTGKHGGMTVEVPEGAELLALHEPGTVACQCGTSFRVRVFELLDLAAAHKGDERAPVWFVDPIARTRVSP